MVAIQPRLKNNSIFAAGLNVPSFTTIMAIHATLWIITLILLLSIVSKNILLATLSLVPILIAIAAHAYALVLLNNREQTAPPKLTKLIHKASWLMSIFLGIAACLLLSNAEMNDVGIIFLWFIPLAIATTVTGESSVHGQSCRLALMLFPVYILLSTTGQPDNFRIATLMALGGILVLFVIIAIRQIISNKIEKLEQYTDTVSTLENRLNGFYKNKSDWTWTSDIETNLTYLSHNAARATTNLMDKNASFGTLSTDGGLSDLLDRREYERFIEAHEKNEAFNNIELKIISSTGETQWFSLCGEPIFNQEGTFKGYDGWAFDITPTVLAREKQKNYQAVLENKVRVRTNKLESKIHVNEAVIQEKESELDTQRKHTLLALQKLESHIHRISEKARTLETNSPTQKRLKIAADIERTCFKLDRIINNLPYILDIDKPSSLQDHQVLSIDDLARNAVHKLQPDLSETGTKIIIEELSGLQLFGDHRLLEKAIYELLFSAIQTTPVNGKISVFIDQDPKGVRFLCEDQSLPIHQSIIDQLKALTNLKTKSSLPVLLDEQHTGLLLAAHLAHTHGGKLSVDRKNSDDGNIITIHLPKARLLKNTA